MSQPDHQSAFYTNQARHVRQCWKEARFVGWTWLVSLVVVCGLIGRFGYLAPDERPAVPRLVWGMPAWVFWGLLVPWVVLIGVAWWFAACFLKDDEPCEEMVGDDPFPGSGCTLRDGMLETATGNDEPTETHE